MKGQLNKAFKRIQTDAGKVCSIAYYDKTIGSVWDDDVAWSRSLQNGSSLVGSTLIGSAVYVIISGVLSPEANGSYIETGTYDGFPAYYYQHIISGEIPVAEDFWIWFYSPGQVIGLPWVISQTKGSFAGGWWGGNSSVSGTYPANSPATGTASGTYYVSGNYQNSYSGLPLWITGIILPINSVEGTTDHLLMQQGLINPSDKKLYLSGDIPIGSPTTIAKIQLGSPTGEQYSLIPLGAKTFEINGDSIFKKAYIRKLSNGSIIGE